MGHESEAEVGYLYLSILKQQEVGRFDISMNDALIMGVLECCCDLAYVRHDGRQWEDLTAWMELIERASGCVRHN